MRQNGEFCDLVFELNNCQFSAHRLVMAAWSRPMKNLLQLQSTSTQHLHMVYDKPDTFHMFITFMYTGALPTQVTNISALLLLGATFQIPLLMEMCEEQLKINTVVDNVVTIYDLSIEFQLPDLEQHSVEFLCKHLTEITQRQELLDLTPSQINVLLGSEHLLKYDPEIKLSLIIAWLAKDTSNREQFLVALLKHVAWSKISDNFVRDIIQTNSVFTSNPSTLYLLLQTVDSSSCLLGPLKNHFQALQKQFSNHLNSICNNSEILSSCRPKHFQTLKFSLISPSTGNPSVADSKRLSENIVGIKNEPVQFVNFDKNEVIIYNDSAACSDVDQNHVNAAQDVPVSANNISKCIGFDKTSSETLCSVGKDVLSEEASSASNQSTGVKNRRRRQLLKSPTLIIRDSVVTRNAALKMSMNKMKESESRLQCRRGRSKGQNVKEKMVAIQQTSSKVTESADVRKALPCRVNRTAKVSSLMGRRTNRGTRLLQSCSQCDYTTYNDKSLEKHHKQVHEGNCLFCCNLCSFKSKWSKEYYDHMKQSHFPGPPFHCDGEQCEYSTDKFQQLVSHRKQHSDQRPFVCDICLTAFRSKNNLYQHFKIHSDEKKFECPECGRSFKLKNTLEQHMVTHSDLRPFLCDLCGFCTKFQSHLISHKRIHTGDVYNCNFESCAYFTPKKSQLKSHMRSHLGIRCHVCGSCGKAFIEKSHLIRHERTHSSERAHVCKECTYSSTRADKLREHIQKHHSDEAPKIKALPSVSKNLGASRKGKVKMTSQGDRLNQGEADSDNDIEVVVMKSNDEHPVSANFIASETVLPNILIGNDVNVRMFETDLPQKRDSSVGTMMSVAPLIGTTVNNVFSNTLEKELCGEDVFNIKKTAFGYQMQPAIVEATGDLAAVASVEKHAIMTCSSIEANRIAAAEDMISQQQAGSTDATVLSYSRAMSASSNFSKPYTLSNQVDSQHGLHVLHGLDDFTTSTNISSAEMQQFYHSQQQQNQEQQHEDLQQQLDIEQSHFLSDDYLY
ncbi:hypothetical protein BsWGS_11577 [Bradybaena similaris]